jgi:hypothetical protein
VLTAGAAVEVKQNNPTPVTPAPARISSVLHHEPVGPAIAAAQPTTVPALAHSNPNEPPAAAVVELPPPPAETSEEPVTAPTAEDEAAGQSIAGTGGIGTPESEGVNAALPSDGSSAGAHSGTGTVVVTVGGSTPPPPPASPTVEATPPPAEPAPAASTGSSPGSDAAAEEAAQAP